jgi:glycosyltransferase involved in cell wall biosynthesis
VTKALIDGHMLGTGETGNETYIRGLLSGLEQLGRREAVAVSGPIVDVGAHEQVVLPYRSNWARLITDLPRAAAWSAADVIHSTYAMPPSTPLARVVTVHDVSFLRHPEWFTRRHRAVLNVGVRHSARCAQRVIVPSEHTRDEVCKLLHIPEARVVVTPEAAGAHFRPLHERAVAEALDRLQIPRPYVLAVGNLQPRKNLLRLLQAWRLLRRGGLESGCRLVLVGGNHGMREPVEAGVGSLDLNGSVHLTGYLSHADLPALYAGARAFVFPTLYEGFGLPLLEAMACGTPVACSRVASLPEVAGDAAAYFDPLNVDDIAATLGALLDGNGLRSALSERGLRRAARFSWRACAEATVCAYEDAVRARAVKRGRAS